MRPLLPFFHRAAHRAAMRLPLLAGLMLLAGCMAPVPPTGPTGPANPGQPAQINAVASGPANSQLRRFTKVVQRVEPVAEAECRARAPRANCDFRIVLDDRPDQPANAFQTLDSNGRPIIAFTLAMLGSVRNADELAFVMGHEAAHHIRGHLGRQRANAQAGATIFAGITALTGGDAQAVRSATRLGAALGARSYSKEFELEADALGTVITLLAGYDPLQGAAFFARIPDPGDRFLGTHPPNSERIRTVRRTLAQGG